MDKKSASNDTEARDYRNWLRRQSNRAKSSVQTREMNRRLRQQRRKRARERIPEEDESLINNSIRSTKKHKEDISQVDQEKGRELRRSARQKQRAAQSQLAKEKTRDYDVARKKRAAQNLSADNRRKQWTSAKQKHRARQSGLAKEKERKSNAARQKNATQNLSAGELENRRELRALARHQQREKAKDQKANYFTMQEESLRNDLGQNKFGFNDIDKSPSKAVLLYYLNSGYFRFQESREYCDQEQHQARINHNLLTQEIYDEELTPSELDTVVKQYSEGNSVNSALLSCASCGIRMFERRQYPEVKFTEICLQSNVGVQLFLSTQECNTHIQRKSNLARISVPTGQFGAYEEKELWRLWSIFEGKDNKYYHLHPELVEERDGKEYALVCLSCLKALSKNTVPKFSLANGVDFGNYHRLGLAEPNLHEQVILSRCRLFQATVKLSLTSGRKVNCNAILFKDDSPEVALSLLSSEAMFHPERLRNTMTITMVDDQGNTDYLFREVYGSNVVFARPWLIFQWFTVLIHVHPHYKDLLLPSFAHVTKLITEANASIKKNASVVNDTEMVAYEKTLGSDYAKQLGKVEEETRDNEEGSQPAMGFRFVSNIHHAHAYDEASSQQHQLRAMEEFIDTADQEDLVHNDEEANDDMSISSFDHLSAQMDYVRKCRSTYHAYQATSDDKHNANAFNEHAKEQFDQLLQGRAGQHLREDKSRREMYPLNDFQTDDFAISTTFPTVFLLGKMYGRIVGALKSDARNHLLRQFTNIPPKNRRLLFFLFDTIKRFEVMYRTCAYVRRDTRSVEVIKKLLSSKQEKDSLNEAIKHPNAPCSKALLRKYMKHLRFAGKDIPYGPMEMSKVKSYLLESCKKYGPASCLLTLAFSEPDNSRALRMTFRTLSNKCFPAVFTEDCEFGTCATDFMAHIRKCTMMSTSGSIEIPDHPHLSRKARVASVIDNPVQYVVESKSIINDVCAILLGIPPEDFFGYHEGTSKRKTKYFKNHKGIFGHCLAYIGVVEDHAKGTLHYHLLFFGGLSPKLLQRFADTPAVCKAIAKVLDTQYKSSVPARVKLGHLIPKVFMQDNTLGLSRDDFASVAEPPLLSNKRYEVLQQTTAITMGQIWDITYHQACMQQFHDHMATCRKGFLGISGCRLCMPCGMCAYTHPVKLVDSKDVSYYQPASAYMPSTVYLFQDREKKDDVDGSFLVCDPCPNGNAHCSSPSILSRCNTSTQDIIVWETSRPYDSMRNVPILINPISFDESGDAFRGTLHRQLVQSLSQLSAYPNPCKFFEWISKATDRKIQRFWTALGKIVMDSNLNIATYSPIVSLCTGSHNNASLLGSEEQAKAAIFYICPYMGKIKFPLQHCLSVLSQNVEHIKRYPSKAYDNGMDSRNAKHVLQRTMNKLMLKMELSDFQVAADLLGLPCVVRSDQFAYLDVEAAMAYNTLLLYQEHRETTNPLFHMQAEEKEETDSLLSFIEDEEYETTEDFKEDIPMKVSVEEQKNTGDDLFQDMGRLQTLTYEDGDKQVKDIVPVSSFYVHRGQELKDLSRYEYAALIKIEKRHENTRSRRAQFLFHESFEPGCQYAQFLQNKHRTVVLTSKLPPHPGGEPDSENLVEYSQWCKKANKYARFLLTMFRPDNSYSGACPTGQAQTWKSLVEWVSSLQADKSIISKFRLMALHTRVKGFHTPFRNKVMVASYRRRNRRIWSEAEKAQHYESQARIRTSAEDFMDEYDFRLAHPSFDAKTMKEMLRQCKYDKGLSANYSKTEASSLWFTNRLSAPKSSSLSNIDSWTIESCAKDIREGPSPEEYDFLDKEHAEGPADFFQAGTDNSSHVQLNKQQQDVTNVYKEYFKSGSTEQLPSIILMHGPAGTGKSSCMNEIIYQAELAGKGTIRTAYNAINAIMMKGMTTCSLASVNADVHSHKLEGLSERAYRKLLNEMDGAAILLIDEISNYPPYVLARLSNAMSQVTGDNSLFGGIPTLLVGDLSQMEPVKAKPLTYALMDIAAVKRGDKNPSRQSKGKKAGKQNPTKKFTIRNIQVPEEQGVRKAENKYTSQHPYTIGANILSEAKWVELSQSERSKDDIHQTKLVNQLYTEKKLSRNDILSNYKHLSKEDFRSPTSPFLSASMIVSTNRERFTLTHLAAIRFAHAKGKFVYRWPSSISKWQGAPADSPRVFEDPCMYEYMVEGAGGFLTDKVCYESNLVNATPFYYDSIAIEDRDDLERVRIAEKELEPGHVITLQSPPLAVNIQLDLSGKHSHLFSDKQKRYLKFKSIHKHKVVIPISRGCTKTNENVLVLGGDGFLPSKLEVKPNFPLEPAFAITVNKAQGRTLDHVILVLSEKPTRIANMGLKELYVALTRVKSRDSVRLLLNGRTELEKFESLAYIDNLKPDITVEAFFAGFSKNKERDWKTDAWDEEKAYSHYVKLK